MRIPSISKATCLSFVLLAACSKAPEASKPAGPPPPTQVDAVVMAPTHLEKVSEVNGAIIAQEYAELRPETAGRLVFLDVREGARVAAGTVVARLFNDDLQATLSRHKAQQTLAQATLNRLEKLLAIDGINRQEFEQAQAQLASVQADIAFTEAQIRKTVVTAPFDGTLGLRNVSPGAYVSPANIICSIQQTGTLKLDFNVPENLAPLVKVGDSVSVQVEGVDKIVRARISAIEPQLNANTRNLKVRAVLPNATGMSPGAFAKVLLNAGTNNQALLLPTQAIVPDTRFKRVFVVRGGKAESVTVETGLRTKSNVEITSG
jgi:membrane fusion protein (multidrug efflux system)